MAWDEACELSGASGGSAEWSGRIRAGDRLITVDGNNVAGRTPSELSQIITGPEGSKVRLGFSRIVRTYTGEQEEPYEVQLVRAPPNRQSPPAEASGQQQGYNHQAAGPPAQQWERPGLNTYEAERNARQTPIEYKHDRVEDPQGAPVAAGSYVAAQPPLPAYLQGDASGASYTSSTYTTSARDDFKTTFNTVVPLALPQEPSRSHSTIVHQYPTVPGGHVLSADAQGHPIPRQSSGYPGGESALDTWTASPAVSAPNRDLEDRRMRSAQPPPQDSETVTAIVAEIQAVVSFIKSGYTQASDKDKSPIMQGNSNAAQTLRELYKEVTALKSREASSDNVLKVAKETLDARKKQIKALTVALKKLQGEKMTTSLSGLGLSGSLDGARIQEEGDSSMMQELQMRERRAMEHAKSVTRKLQRALEEVAALRERQSAADVTTDDAGVNQALQSKDDRIKDLEEKLQSVQIEQRERSAKIAEVSDRLMSKRKEERTMIEKMERELAEKNALLARLVQAGEAM